VCGLSGGFSRGANEGGGGEGGSCEREGGGGGGEGCGGDGGGDEECCDEGETGDDGNDGGGGDDEGSVILLINDFNIDFLTKCRSERWEKGRCFGRSNEKKKERREKEGRGVRRDLRREG
jgi:hypothetical protein